MTEIQLPGLRADLPICAMAAFGCLRVCQRLRGFGSTKLGWTIGGGAHCAVLLVPEGATRESLITELAADVRRFATRPELTWKEQIKTVLPAEFRKAAGEVLAGVTADGREFADWLAAFGSELATDRNGRLKPTPFDMTVARQRFVADAAKLAASLSESSRGKSAEEAYAEALFGPWRYQDDQHSLGWDPTTIRLGAFTHKAPTGMVNAGVRAAVWLAFESLPLFPCFFAAGLRVRSFQGEEGEFVFCWPVWKGFVGLESLQFLLSLRELTTSQPQQAELSGRGVVAVYRSERFKPNKYLASFRLPELAFAAPA